MVTRSNRYLMDSGIIIRELRGDSRAAALLDELSSKGDLIASAITVFETYRGCRTPDEQRAAADLFRRISALDLTYDAAKMTAELMSRYRGVFSSERAAADAMIAGAAITSASILVTLNTRQFAREPIADLQTLVLDQEASDWTISIP